MDKRTMPARVKLRHRLHGVDKCPRRTRRTPMTTLWTSRGWGAAQGRIGLVGGGPR